MFLLNKWFVDKGEGYSGIKINEELQDNCVEKIKAFPKHKTPTSSSL